MQSAVCIYHKIVRSGVITFRLTAFSHSISSFHFALPDFSQTTCFLFILPRYNKAIETNRKPASEQERSFADESLTSIIMSKVLNSTRHFIMLFLHEYLSPPLTLTFSPSLFYISARKCLAFGCFVLLLSQLIKHFSCGKIKREYMFVFD